MKKKVIEKVKSAESNISMILGIVVVIVAGVILFNYFKGFIKRQSENTESNVPTQEETFTENVQEGTPTYNGNLPTKYIVLAGDSLWTISEKFFGYGYNWVDISKENNLTDPGQINVGQELSIPKVEVKKPVLPTLAKQEVSNPIEGETYVVQKGDDLWDISVRAYLDGFQWTKIAQANNLENPNIIHPGNVLTIPR